MPKEEYEYQPNPNEKYKMKEIGVEESKEYWNEYKLEDGTTLKVKHVLVRAGKSVDKPIPNSGGEPLYHIQTHTVVNTTVPEDQYFSEGSDKD